ncbi:MAG TPA: hypothetical protein EYN67_03560 [Flavobacteriales bacterium]|nr:hypothetical protein [Flavobacteriales bacterium]
MKVGDLVKFEADNAIGSVGVIVAMLPRDRILASAVSVLWTSGELVERVPPRILEVISESR